MVQPLWTLHSTFEKLKTIYQKYRFKGFEIIGISTDEKKNKADWKKAIIRYNLSWKHFWDVNGFWAQKLSINSFPTNFLLDNTGKIIAKNIEPTELEKLLEKNLKE